MALVSASKKVSKQVVSYCTILVENTLKPVILARLQNNVSSDRFQPLKKVVSV